LDNKRTLMHYLVETAEKHFTDVVDLADELLHVDKAARGDINLHSLATKLSVGSFPGLPAVPVN
jgi:hypothetical protein